MKTHFTFFPALLLFVILTFLGQSFIRFHLLFGMKIFYDENLGLFIKWNKLNSSITFVEIIDAIPDKVLAKTSNEEIYLWDSSANCLEEALCNQWVKQETTPLLSENRDSLYEPLLIKQGTCSGIYEKFKSFKDPSGEIINCYFTTGDESYPIGSSYYALLTDGTIWVWSNIGEDEFGVLTVIYSLSIFFSLTISTAIFVLIMIFPKNIEQKRENIQTMKNVFLCCFLCIGGVVAGYKIGHELAKLRANGIFTSWELLESPYKFEEIINANYSTVWARAENGKIYSWTDQWLEVNEIPSDNDEQQFTKSNSCSFNEGISFVKEPSSEVIECAFWQEWRIDVALQASYILLEDGTIWSRRYINDLFNAIFYFVPISTCSGFLFAILIFSIIMKRNSKRKENLKQIAINNQ